MRIFVTAGNTLVPIDRVRSITNIFTGRTGAAIALEAHRRGHDVTLATSHPRTASFDLGAERWHCLTYRTFDDLEAIMGAVIGQASAAAVVHCAAVNDYRAVGIFAPAPTTHFDPADGTWDAAEGVPRLLDRAAGKVKSDDPELWLRLVRTPKLVDKIRSDWSFRGLLVKFKLEVDVSEGELLASAEKSRLHSAAEWMVANTLEGAEEWAYLGNAGGYKKISRADLAGSLLDVIERHKESQHG